MEEVVDRVRTSISENTRYERVIIHLIADGGRRMEVVGWAQPKPDLVHLDVALIDVANDRMLQRSLAAREPYVIPDLRQDPEADQKLVAMHGNRTAICVPMFEGDARIGPMVVLTFADEGVIVPTEEELDFIVQVGSLVGVVIGRLRAEEARRKAEEKSAANERMHALGRMAGEIAHDINNVLVTVLASAELAALEVGDHRAKRYLVGIEQSAMRARDFTRQLVSYARGQVLEKHPVNVEDLLGAIESLIRPTLPAGVALHLSAQAGLGAIVADRVELERVLLNLAVNARDALGSQGSITIDAERITIDSDTVAGQGKVPLGRYLRLSVSDDGAGMSSDTMAHIFEPFFTTKREQRGTGLGLAVVDGVVRQHGGFVEVYSELGHGTTFRVYLPLGDMAADPQNPEPADEGPELKGREPILVVDDDELVRSTVSDVLERAACKVIQCGSAEEAVEMLRHHAVDLLLTDVVLRGGSGVALAEEARKSNPTLPVLYMTGYARGKLAELRAPHLTKPFGASELLRQIRRALQPR